MSNNTINTYQGNGTTTTFLIGFDYIKRAFVEVYLDGTLQTLFTDYTFQTNNVILFNTAPPDNSVITIRRNTEIKELIHPYIDPAILLADNLNRSFTQPLHGLEEIEDNLELSEIKRDADGNIDLEGHRIINSGEPINDSDLATKGYVDKNDTEILDFAERIDGDVIRLTNATNSSLSDLQTQIDGIVVAGTQISAKAGNAITVEPDGLFSPDLSGNITAINNSITALNNDSTAQWVKINDTVNNVNALTTRTTAVEGVAGGNTTAITELDDRVVVLESAPSGGGGFNTRDVIQTSGDYTALVDGWYKITVIGGGGGAGCGGSVYFASTVSVRCCAGGGGGAAGAVASRYIEMASGEESTITIGAGGVGGYYNVAATDGGNTSFATSAVTITAPAGKAGGNGQDTTTGRGGRGGSVAGVDGGDGAGASGGGGAATNGPGFGGTGGNNGTAFGGGGGGGGGGGYTAMSAYGGRGGSSGAVDGQDGREAGALQTAYGGDGGAGANGAVIIEYYNPNL